MSEAVPHAVIDEPTALRSFATSISAVLVKEARWRMRGRRAFVLVSIYVALLALLVFAIDRLVQDSLAQRAQWSGMVIEGSGMISGAESAIVGQTIFATLLSLQLVLTLLVAPALSSGAISGEREKQTLEMLITTPASTLGLVAGKLASSLAFVVLLTLASVPLMSLVFVFGGIAPDDVLRAYVYLLVVAFGIGSIGLLLSAMVRRSQVATALAYVVVFVLCVVTLFIHTWASVRSGDFDGRPQPASELLLLLNPFVGELDLLCTAIPDSFGVTCAYSSFITGGGIMPADPQRDVFWPRSAAAFALVGIGLTLLTTQLIAPSRRLRRLRRRTQVQPAAEVSPPPA